MQGEQVWGRVGFEVQRPQELTWRVVKWAAGGILAGDLKLEVLVQRRHLNQDSERGHREWRWRRERRRDLGSLSHHSLPLPPLPPTQASHQLHLSSPPAPRAILCTFSRSHSG